MYQKNKSINFNSDDDGFRQTITPEEADFWFRFTSMVPWEKIEAGFSPLFAVTRIGTPEEQARMLFGALIIREKYRLNNQEVIKFIAEEPYLQYFIGVNEFGGELPIDEGILEEFCGKLDLRSYGLVKELLSLINTNKEFHGNNLESGSSRQEAMEPSEEPADFYVEKMVKPESPDHLDRTAEFPAIKEVESEFPDHWGETTKLSGVKTNPSTGQSALAFSKHWHQFLSFLGSCWQEICLSSTKWFDNHRRTVRVVTETLQHKFIDAPEIKGNRAWTILNKAFHNLVYWSTLIFLKTWIRITTLILVILAVGFFLFILFLPVPAPRMLMASEVYDLNHGLAATFYSENRRPVKLNEIPEFLRQAVIAVEDHRFYRHNGVNLGRILKAAVYDLLNGNLEQGGSTITQQLVKNVYLTHERTFSRKIREVVIASKMELQLTKDQILELYLNKIYFGHGAYGVKVAAQTYFQRELAELSPAQMAMLAGLPRGPAFYSPYNHPQEARERMLHTLSRMKECGYISATDYEKYSRQKLELPGLNTKNNSAPYFMDLLQSEINKIFPENPEMLYTEGLIIESTLDLTAQKAAQKAFIAGLPKLVQRQGGISQPQGALVALDPKNGEIRALVGGSDYSRSQFNRATQAKRQPGSAFKPLVYAAAFGNGYTLASKFDRTPQTYNVFGKSYRPTDHNNNSATGMLSLRNALATSSNVVAVKLLQTIGYKPVINMARQLGIQSKLYPSPSMALGTCEVTPIELATAYLPFANGGTLHKPTTIRRILDRQGRVLYRNSTTGRAALDPNIAFLVTQALTDVLKTGTAANVGNRLQRPAAGKTGTTNSNRDTWFVGYTPDLLACVFIGCDHYERSLPGVAGYVAAPIWAKFMTEALKKVPAQNFPVPANIKTVTICKSSGDLAKESCPSQTEYFISGTEPLERCDRFHINLHFFNDQKVEPEEDKNLEAPKEPERTEEPKNSGKTTINQKINKIFKRIFKMK
jgi:1A family penicillin-binding protein